MTEVTRAWRWPSRRYPNGCWVAGRLRTPVCRETRPHTLSDPLYLKYTEMKRKVMNTGKLRLSPNEEAFVLKEDYERRRKLRLLQVREQERGIAFQIREDIKQRRNQQFSRLAEELRAEWEEAQSQKIQNLEKLYLASLRHMGEGHRQAKENEPDLDALAQRAAERKRKAELRHKEALKVQKNQKEVLMKQKTRHIKARKEALLVEKERSAKVARLPPPVPAPFENIEVNRIPSLKTNSSTYHHISTFVSRQMGTKQPDALLAAEEETRRLEGLRRQAAQQRAEQFERAHVRGSRAMKKVHLAQNQERLMEELKQLQKEDLARRRQTVAQMPPQLVELPYRRSEVKEDWQRELECAFEDMYNADRKVKGNLILHLTPEPLPDMSEQLQDEELDLSMERENRVPFTMKTQQIPSRILFKRLLNKIRSQKSLWTIRSVSEDGSELTASSGETESRTPTMESGTTALEERTLSSEQEQVMDSDKLTIESGPLSSEDKPFFCQADAGKEQAVAAFPPVTAVTQCSALLHPQEEAVKIRMSARHKQIMEIEEQKQKQLELLEQIEQQKLRLETDCFRAQLEEEENRKKTQQPEVCSAPVSHAMISDEDCHRQMIRNYQHQLLQQNRLHRQSVETARKRLLEYQTVLKERYPSLSPTSLIPDSVISGPAQKSQKCAAAADHWVPCQRLKLSPNKYQPVQSSQIPALDQSHIQTVRQGHFPQRQGETGTSEMLAKQSVGSQKHLQQFSQAEAHQRDYKFVPKDSHAPSRTLSYDRPQTLLDTEEVSKPLRATTCQTLDSKHISSEDSENISSKPTEPSSFLPLVPERSFTSLPVKHESGKVQEPFTTISKSTISVNQSVISQTHDQPLSSSGTIKAQHINFKFPQEHLEPQKEGLQARQEAQEKLAYCTQKELEKQAGLPVFPSSSSGDLFSSLPSASAESGKIQASSAESEATVSSGSVDRLWGFSQPASSQQTNLEFLQEQISVQKDNLQARREAQEVLLAHKQSKLDETVHSEETRPSGPHHMTEKSFSSLTLTDRQPRKIQEQPLPTNKKGLLPSQSEISRSQDGSSSFIQQIPPIHSSLKLLQERLATQRDAIQARDEGQEELLLHRERSLGDTVSGPVKSLSSVVTQHSDASRVVSEVGPKRSQELYSFEKENIVPASHLITPALQEETRGFPHHRQEHFTTLQEQLHFQRVILGARKEAQEYAYKENELEKGLRCQQTGTLSSSSQGAEWERFQEFMSVKSDSTEPLSLKIPGFQERLVRFSQHTFPMQNNLQEHHGWEFKEKESFQFSPQTRENSSQQTGLSSFMPSSCVSLPSADSATTQSDSKVTSSHLQIPELQDRLWKISQLIQPQQDSLKALQEQLATQREAIIQCRQEAHEEILREWKEGVFPEQVRKPTGENDLKIQNIEQLGGWLPLVQGPAWGVSDPEGSSGEQPCSADVHDEHSGESLGKDLSGRASKPPVSKVKCGLDLNQHELSTIQEVESPASGRTSMPGKSDFCQDRDPLRVSVSREQSFLGSPLACDPFGCHQPPAQNSRSHDCDEAVKVKESDVENHAVLSHAVSEEAASTYLGPAGKPDDKAETQEMSQELLSSVTVSTGSFLSYEVTDLSLTDPESFSEQTELQEQDSTTKQEETSPFSCAAPSPPVSYQQPHPLGANESLLPKEEEKASDHTHVQQIIDKDLHEANLIPEKRDFQVSGVDLDFPELEHVFPHLHHQLFKPLEPYLDFDLSSSSGISQDNRHFHEQSSESSSKIKESSRSTACFTALRGNLHSLNSEQPVNLAHAAIRSFAAEGPEQSFKQLLPEFSSPESQHADLPSIYSIEARDASQGMENHDYSEETEILQKKKSVHFQSSAENLSPACSSDGATVFNQLHLLQGSPSSSTPLLGFEELSRKMVAVPQSQRLTQDKKEAINPHVENSEGSHSLSVQNEMSIQNRVKTETTNPSRLSQAEHIMNSFPSSIPVWETESGYGIMEEPDLTLVSTSDISIAETDLANLTLEERDSEAQSCSQADATSTGAILESCMDQPQVAPSVTPMKRKKTFMDRSYQRQRETRNKAQLTTGLSLSRGKGINKVRAPLPEERRTTQALIHQRALRLYRQLAEVKQQKEEKTKQEVCAQNRARAKEFHKVSRSQFFPLKSKQFKN
uniref:centrosomal protein of 295 kDa isoform X7 n=1 Tax=Myodes glareolus TaxID=447135 RepID=UPI002021468C|nr:centrosomal protein of 295 kDa isoform X7 [Myodes glareolus]